MAASRFVLLLLLLPVIQSIAVLQRHTCQGALRSTWCLDSPPRKECRSGFLDPHGINNGSNYPGMGSLWRLKSEPVESRVRLLRSCCSRSGESGRCIDKGKEGSTSPTQDAALQGLPRVGPSTAGPRPDWFHVPAPRTGKESRYSLLTQQIRKLGLSTVCEEAKCPNIGECWEGGTATLMLLGDTCTRGCRFCAIKTSAKPPPPDPLEPEKVAAAVAQWEIDYVVLTSVDRDDMPDGGAAHFARTVKLIKEAKPDMLVECLVSDFQGMDQAITTVARSGLDVYAHNLETVRRLTSSVRDRRASYKQSLDVLYLAKERNPAIFTKTSLMLGLGETQDEVHEALRDIKNHGVDAVTIGQYLQPTSRHLGVMRFVLPEEFKEYERFALDLGFKYVASGPLTRSSYKAGEFFISNLLKKQRAKLQADIGDLKGEVGSIGQSPTK